MAGHAHVALNAWVTHRFDRTLTVTAPGTPTTTIHPSFGTRFTLLAVAGYVFESEAALGGYVNLMNEGVASINGSEDFQTRLRLTTVGLAGVLPVRDRWRIQGVVFSDLRWTLRAKRARRPRGRIGDGPLADDVEGPRLCLAVAVSSRAVSGVRSCDFACVQSHGI